MRSTTTGQARGHLIHTAGCTPYPTAEFGGATAGRGWPSQSQHWLTGILTDPRSKTPHCPPLQRCGAKFPLNLAVSQLVPTPSPRQDPSTARLLCVQMLPPSAEPFLPGWGRGRVWGLQTHTLPQSLVPASPLPCILPRRPVTQRHPARTS